MPDGGPGGLAYGVVADRDGARRVVARAGDGLATLAPLAHAGALDVPTGTFDEPSLNRLLDLGRGAWTAVSARLGALLAAGEVPLSPVADATPVLPVRIGDYVDCYSSLEHARNVGLLFRPDAPDPLPAAWRHLPIAYHGRAGTVVASGTPVTRPSGMRGPADHGPERKLDFELELGFVCGPGRRVRPDDAAEHLFGVVLLNDWSARELQFFEYQPLGPFLGKSFATSISPWVVPLDALAHALVAGPRQDPPPAAHLRSERPWGLDAELEAEVAGTVVTRVNARGLYWTAAQQLAHVTSNGASVRAGDLIGSGTVSGDGPGAEGCLLERTRDGAEPLALDGGGTRAYLEDGDTVVLRGRAGHVDLGEVRGTVQPAAG